MNWWGKLLGGSFGYMLGGPLGALLGAALGHQLDRGIKSSAIDFDSNHPGDTERVQTVFFTTTFLVMGHLAKADGRVTESEIAAAKHIMQQMQLTAEQRQTAIALFNQGKDADFDLESVIIQFKNECGRRRNLSQMFIEILLATAMADGHLDALEKQLLVKIAKILGFSRLTLERLIMMVQAQQQNQNANRAPGQNRYNKIEDAFKMLGLEEKANNSEVKKAYRTLINQHHPDKLVSRGLPEEMLKIATEKTQDIKAAYEQIKKHRGFK